VFQTLALLAGISRSGICLVGGLVRGLDHEDAAKFAFLLATPVIFAAGVLNDEAYRILLANSRFPGDLEGDTRALMASCRLGVERLEELLRRYGRETVLAAYRNAGYLQAEVTPEVAFSDDRKEASVVLRVSPGRESAGTGWSGAAAERKVKALIQLVQQQILEDPARAEHLLRQLKGADKDRACAAYDALAAPSAR